MKKALLATLICMSSVASYAQSAEPIKIVGSLDLSGPAAALGKDALLGVQFAVEVLNKGGGVLGRPVSFTYQDNGTNPQRAIDQATALLGDGAVMLVAPQSSASTLAVSKTVSAKQRIPMCVSVSGSDSITMKDFQPYVFSVTPNSYFEMGAEATRLAKKPYKRYVLLAADYAGTRPNAQRFKEFLKQKNPDVEFVLEEYPKLGAIDYTSSINKILAAKPDYVFSLLYGTDLLTFSKQASAVGFFKQIDGKFAAIYDETVLKALGDTAGFGSDGAQRAPASYLASASPESREYISQFKAKHGFMPSDWTTLAYDCVMIWAQAVTNAKSIAADAVMHAIETSEFRSMRGPLHFGKDDHQANSPVFMGRIEYSKELQQPVMAITDIVPGDVLRPSQEVLLKSRQ